MSWAQVWDILAVTLEKVHYLLPRRRCGCGRTTTAAPPFGAAGSVVYWPRINAAAILLASEGNVPIERTAMLMEALLGVAVSSGFVGRAVERLAQRLAAAGFDDATITALRASDVLCADETPTNVVSTDTDEHRESVAGSAYAVTVRTPDARLVWYAPIGSRSKTAKRMRRFDEPLRLAHGQRLVYGHGKLQGPSQGGGEGGREFSLSGSLPCLPALSCVKTGQGGSSIRFPMPCKSPISGEGDITGRLPPSLRDRLVDHVA